MKIRNEEIYRTRRRNTALIGAAALLSILAIKEGIDDNTVCEGTQTVLVKNDPNADGTFNPDRHFTVWDAIDKYVKYDSNVNKQEIVGIIEDQNPGIEFGNLEIGDRLTFPVVCHSN